MVSSVKYGTPRRPGMAGIIGDDPVAMTKRRALIVASPATTVRGSTKRAFSGNDIHAKAREAFACCIRRQRADDTPHIRLDGREVDSGAGRLDAELCVGPRGVGAIGRRYQGLCGDAAAIEAFAAQAAFFDQRRRKVEGGRRGGNGKSAGTRADHANLRRDFSIILRHQPAEPTAIEQILAEIRSLAHDADFLMACPR